MEADFRENFFDRRLDLLANLNSYVKEGRLKERDFLALHRPELRFSYGESDLDIKIPFILGGESEEIFEDAIEELITIIQGRVEPHMLYTTQGVLIIPTTDRKTKLLPKSYKIGADFTTRVEKNIAAMTIYSDPVIDAGIIASWFSPRLNGKRFIGELFRIYRKSIEEEMRLGGAERTAYITHIAIAKVLNEKKELIKTLKIKGINYERLERSLSIFFYSILFTIISELLNIFRGKQLSYDMRELEYLLLNTITPFFILNIKNTLLNNEPNPYNISLRISEKLDTLYDELAKRYNSPPLLIAEMTSRVMQEKTLIDTILEFYSLSKFRDDIINYLISYDNQKEGIHILLSEIYQDEKLLKMIWTDSKMSSTIESGLSDLIDRFYLDVDRIHKIRQILSHFKSQRKWGLVRFFSQNKEELEYKIAEVMKRYVIFRMDQNSDSIVSTLKQSFENKKRSFTLKELLGEYEAGRIYRFSGDQKPFLMHAQKKKEGHLFVDLKGFTRRTKRSGSHVMADFLKYYFYVPILESAKKHYLRIGREPSLGIELNNLLGDAIIFSGNLVALVSLAKDIQRISSDYKRKLILNNPDFDDKSIIEKLQNQYQNELVKLTQEGRRIVKAIAGLNRLVKSKQAISPEVMLDAQMRYFDKSIQANIEAMGDIAIKIKQSKDGKKQQLLMLEEEDIRNHLAVLQSFKKDLLSEVKKQRLDLRSKDFYREICQDELRQIERLKSLLADLYKKKRELTKFYYGQLGEVIDVGMNTGLYISYGGVSESIALRDDVWGVIKVNIADKINEASRGAARNVTIKKRLDQYVEKRRFAKGNKNLVYPFNVIIAQNYVIIHPIDEEPALSQKSSESFLNYAEYLVNTEKVQGNDIGGLEGWSIEEEIINPEFVSQTDEIYNLGEALSQEALLEYMKETRSRVSFFQKRVLTSELNQKFWDIFAFDESEIFLVFGVEHSERGVDFELYRNVGELDYAGTEKKEMTDVFEMIRPDSAFYQFIQKYHFDQWYKDAKKTIDLKNGIMQV